MQKPLVASYTEFNKKIHKRNIVVVCNKIKPKMETCPKKNPKYKKVGKAIKEELLELVEEGFTIVTVYICLFRLLPSSTSITPLLNPSSSITKNLQLPNGLQPSLLMRVEPSIKNLSP